MNRVAFDITFQGPNDDQCLGTILESGAEIIPKDCEIFPRKISVSQSYAFVCFPELGLLLADV